MTIYAVLKAYNSDDSIRYDVLPYNFKGTLKCYFSKDIHRGSGIGYNLFTRINQFVWFISKCRISKSQAKKLANRLTT